MPDSAAPVLIVEDERIVARDLQRTLLGFGYDAFAIAASCEEALARAEEKTPAVVLMDIRIKGELDGIATARMLRERFASAVVYLTSHADPDTLQRATATEPSGYLQKPVRPAELRSAIEISLHKRQAEARWREGERWIDSALSAVADGVIAVHPNGRILEVNAVAAGWLGKPVMELRGTPIADALRLFEPASGGAMQEPTATAMREGKEQFGQAYVLQGDGSERRVTYRVQPVRSLGCARVLGAILIMSEVPQLAAAGVEARDPDRSFRAMVDGAPVGIHVHRDGKFIYANAAFARALGYDDPEQLIGRSIISTVHPDSRRVVLDRIANVSAGAGGVPGVVPTLRRDGSVIYMEGTGFPLTFGGAPATCAVLQDITARRAVDAALQENETRYRHLFRDSPVSLWEVDWSQLRTFLDARAASGVSDVLAELETHPDVAREVVSLVRVLDVNEATLRMVGARNMDEVQREFARLFVPATHRVFNDFLRFLLRGETGTFAADAKIASLTGEPREVDVRLTVMPGSEQSWSRILVSLIDTTLFKAVERELRASLREKEVLLKEVHHRVKNNLQVISSLLNLQAMQLLDPDVRRRLVESQSRVQAIALVHDKLYQSKDLSHIAFAEYAQALVKDLAQAADAEERGVAWSVTADEVRLGVDAAIPCGLVLNELVSNALKHGFPEGRTGSIRVHMARTSDRLCVSVEDDGVGLPAGLDPSLGETLGFDLVYTFAEQLDAEVSVERRAAGTRVTISFAEK